MKDAFNHRIGSFQRMGKTHAIVVLPTAGGPKISVTWPLVMPPHLSCWLRGREPLSSKVSSRCGKPVEMADRRVDDRFCSAAAADTVGRRSQRSSACSCSGTNKAKGIRDEEDVKFETSCSAIKC